jgi:hypothetical protein
MNPFPSGINATAVTAWPAIPNTSAAATHLVTVTEFPFSIEHTRCRTTGMAFGMCRDACCRPDLHPSNTIWIEVNA